MIGEMIRSGADRFAAEEDSVGYANSAEVVVILYDRETGVVVSLDAKITRTA